MANVANAAAAAAAAAADNANEGWLKMKLVKYL